MSKKRPNFLIITTDEERFPPIYENAEAREWRIKNTPGQQEIRQNALVFNRHYTAATACSPARATIYTGQYPSLHGVSQTPGMGKSSFDPSMFWLDPRSVPTMGHWFREIGYRTIYRGKWHVSDADLIIPGSRTALMTNDVDGNPYPEKIKNYEDANRLDQYGWESWIGPEPHGALEANDGLVRDPGFADQVCRTLDQLEEEARQNKGDNKPFILVSSFVNPHDVVFYGVPNWFDEFTKEQQAGLLPDVERAPTADEALESKPRCQKDYAQMYPRFYVPQPDTDAYRQFYYWLIARVDTHIKRVYDRLKKCSFFEDTIVVLTSDHGEMLGAHGGLHQKWYNAYEETLHVQFAISNPVLFPKKVETDALTSHIDILPTLMGLAGVGANEVDLVAHRLKQTHYEVQDLVGRNLAPLVEAKGQVADDDAVVYFMSDDTIETGADMSSTISNRPYRPVIQPSHLETIITRLPGENGPELWKYSRYFDNPRFVRGPGNQDNLPIEAGVPPEFECYNLTRDPLEQINLLSPVSSQQCPPEIHHTLRELMRNQRLAKRKLPQNVNLGTYSQYLPDGENRNSQTGSSSGSS